MRLPARTFWFLRHGETEYNARGLSQGALDIELNETGRAQAAAAALLLKDRGIERIVASPMLRARRTAEIVNQQLGLPLALQPDLREVMFGGMEGVPMQPWFGEWLSGRATPAGAESFAAVLSRVANIMPAILAAPGLVLIVAHGGVFRALRELMGQSRDEPTRNAEPLCCAPVGGGWRISAAALTADG